MASGWLKQQKAVALVATLIICVVQALGQVESLDELRERQINALMTGDVSYLRIPGVIVGIDSRALGYTIELTSTAAEMFRNRGANVHRESALLLSKFIYQGAVNLAGLPLDPWSPQRLFEAKLNLKKFVNAELELGKRENAFAPVIGESTFEKIRVSICPLWPFC